MKKKRINYSGFWPGFDKENNLFTDILREKFEVEISDKPDYVFASLFEVYPYMQYDCVRILYAGEPYSPDFNVFDYAIGFDPMELSDEDGKPRYYRFPYCFYDEKKVGLERLSKGLSQEDAREILQKKKYFCNFIYSHPSAKGEREAVFDMLNRFKRVESAGSFLNNMPGGETVSRDEGKPQLLRDSKFTIACESIVHPGFVTEKITDAFIYNSIPIYYGSDYVRKEFNPEAFINIRDYHTIEAGIEKVIQIDRDDDLYIQMLMQPKLITENHVDEMYEGLRSFLFQIFEQDEDAAYRRLRFYGQKDQEQRLKEYDWIYGSPEYRAFKIRQRIKRKFKR